jgi:hypothetical protein
MRPAILIAVALLMAVALACFMACDQVSNIASADLEDFFRHHKVDGDYVVAMKKRSLGTVSYFATIHGYPDNLSVCEAVIAPYNKNESLSAIPGEYFCEVLR